MNSITSSLIGIILVSLVIYLIKNILPNGNMKKYTNIVYGALLTLLLVQTFANLYTINLQSDTTGGNFANVEHLQRGIEIQIKNISGFENSQVTVDCANGKISSIRITAYSADSDNIVMMEKNKLLLIDMLTIIYDIEKNNIFIEVI